MEPPPYHDADGGDEVDKELLPPTILLLAGQTIHAETATSTPLYELSRGVSTLSDTDQSVEFSRVEHAVKPDAYGQPQVACRSRHIYDLKHPPAILSTSAYPFHISSSSRGTLGDVGLKKLSLPQRGFQANRLGRSGQPDRLLFRVKPKRPAFEWIDFNGRAIAFEDPADSQFRLVTTVPLERETVDALVALWSTRLWLESAAGKKDALTMDGGENY
ncbi:hypothetical protein F4780DRAFT_661842 [Xylariomycetidae sp. FL0641]|nr:hypothetical protein F4780DRAFT_661842 [Xylariomycetidae sp. FL0641]